MKIQYCSDLHLEFAENSRWLKVNPIIPKGDILIIAGDTNYLGVNFGEHPFFDQVSKDFEQVYLIPGNHEYYRGYDAVTSAQPTKYAIRDNVFFVNNWIVELESVELVFSILWSKIVRYPEQVAQRMSDFRLIRFRELLITVQEYNWLHHKCWSFLQEVIFEKKQKTRIVITHHLPSAICTAKEFENSLINEGFCTDLTKEIEKAHVNYWIYGHSHRNKSPFKIGKTKMLTNQLGYTFLGEIGSFNRSAIIEV